MTDTYISAINQRNADVKITFIARYPDRFDRIFALSKELRIIVKRDLSSDKPTTRKERDDERDDICSKRDEVDELTNTIVNEEVDYLKEEKKWENYNKVRRNIQDIINDFLGPW